METPSATPSAPQPTVTATPAVRQPLTKEQRDAIFAAAAANMQPARAGAITELLEWKSQILEYYAKGFSAAQIREFLRAGNVTASQRVVQRFIGQYSHHRKRATASVKSQASDTPATTPTPRSAAAEASGSRQLAASSAPTTRQSATNPGPGSATPKRS